MSASMPLPVPLHAVLGGRYRLDAVLGRGGFGAVYQATQLDIGRAVAVKVLHAHDVTRESLVRFEREARATGSLGHPHIVQITDFQSSPVPFLVMELLPGRSLAEVLQAETRLAVPRAVRLGIQALSALAATHRIGVVHRDIKPANLMIVPTATGEENLKVLDFGVAKDLAAGGTYATATGQVLGTLGYMAPEQALGSGVGPRTDVYSVATVLYRALSGERPYGEARGADLVRLLVTNVPFMPLGQRAPHTPAALCQVVDRALAADPQVRPASAEAFAAELAQSIGMPVPPWAHVAPSSQGNLSRAAGPGPYVSLPPGGLAPEPSRSATMAAPPQKKSAGALIAIAAVLGLLLLGGLAGASYVGYTHYKSQGSPSASAAASTTPPTGAASVSAAPTEIPVSTAAMSASGHTPPSTARPAVPPSPAAARSSKPAPSMSAAPSPSANISQNCLCRDENHNAMCAWSKGLGCTCVGTKSFICSTDLPGTGCKVLTARDQKPGSSCAGRDHIGAPATGMWNCRACMENFDTRTTGVHDAPCKGYDIRSGLQKSGTFDCKFLE